MMFCEKCGSKNEDNAAFCENCGAPLQNMMQPPVNENMIVDNVPVYDTQNTGIPVINSPIVPKQPRKPVSKLTIAIVVEILALVCMAYVLYGFSTDYFGPEHRAKAFFEHMANAEWGDAYEMLDIDESTFINKHFFEMANRTQSLGNIVNYKVQKSTIDDSSQISKNVNIKYSVSGSGENRNYSTTVDKSKKKEFYLFDRWNINSGSYICDSYMIYVPNGSTVTFDGVTLDDKYIYDDSYSNDKTTVYLIQKLFKGCHDIIITQDGMEDVAEVVDISESYQEYDLKNMKLKDDTAETIENIACNNMKNIYTAAIKYESFSSIANMFTQDKEELEDISDSYEYLCENLNSDYFAPYKITFKEIYEQLEDDGSINVTFQLRYLAEYTYTNYWDDKQENDKSSGDINIKMKFVNENGKWVQTNLGCPSLY